VGVLEFLVFGAHVFPSDCTGLDLRGQTHRLFEVLLELFLHCAGFQASHCLRFEGIRRGTFSLLNRKLDLVEQTQSRASLFLHNVVGQLAVESDFEVAQGILNQIPIVHF